MQVIEVVAHVYMLLGYLYQNVDVLIGQQNTFKSINRIVQDKEFFKIRPRLWA
jgi:hypothetical protein